MTQEQKQQLRVLLALWAPAFGVTIKFRHGDCIGADDQAARIAKELGYFVVAHPGHGKTPGHTASRAYSPADEVMVPEPYLKRDKTIVIGSNIMIATPYEASELIRSGTWTTVRYARKAQRELYIIHPDGTVAQ